MRALATLTSASYSSPFFAIVADSVSMSTPLPSARIVCGSCFGVKVVDSIVAESAESIAFASASWKSTSMRRKPGVSAFARLFASTLWRSEAPEMARSKPSWVLSMRVTGRDQGTARGECFVRPWTSLRPPSMGVTRLIGVSAPSFSPRGLRAGSAASAGRRSASPRARARGGACPRRWPRGAPRAARWSGPAALPRARAPHALRGAGSAAARPPRRAAPPRAPATLRATRPARAATRARPALRGGRNRRACLPRDLVPGVAQLAQELRHVVDLLGILLDPRLHQQALAERVDRLEVGGPLARRHVERRAQLGDDRLGPPQPVVRHGEVARPHRRRALDQEAVGAVVEHHHQALRRRGEDRAVAVGLLGRGVGGQWASQSEGRAGERLLTRVVGSGGRGFSDDQCGRAASCPASHCPWAWLYCSAVS